MSFYSLECVGWKQTQTITFFFSSSLIRRWNLVLFLIIRETLNLVDNLQSPTCDGIISNLWIFFFFFTAISVLQQHDVLVLCLYPRSTLIDHRFNQCSVWTEPFSKQIYINRFLSCGNYFLIVTSHPRFHLIGLSQSADSLSWPQSLFWALPAVSSSSRMLETGCTSSF